MKIFKCFFYSLLISLIAQPVSAQSQQSKPKIGLVLSGGGAKGLAHIGVLKTMEEAGITPDYITGTSMGSIVGALYAMGYSADEISEIAVQADWEDLLSDHLTIDKIEMDEKETSKRYHLTFPYYKNKFKLPSGLIEGQRIENYFSDLLWPLTDSINFDSLAIPFRCASVDLISGQAIIHKSGNLAQAIRASMSIPSVFSPTKLDSLLLIDGGLMQNFPVAEVKKMGADIVIGVYVGFNKDATSSDFFSLSDVLSRSTSLIAINDFREVEPMVDYLIVPDLKGLEAADFNKAKKILEYGLESAKPFKNQFKQLADSLALSLRKPSKKYSDQSVFLLDIAIEGGSFYDDYIRDRLNLDMSKRHTKHDIKKAIELLYGTQYFTKVTYTLTETELEDTYILGIKVKEKSLSTANVALNYNHQSGLSVIGNLTLRNKFGKSSKLLASVNASRDPGLSVEYNNFWNRKQRFMNYYFLEYYYNTLEVTNLDTDNSGTVGREQFYAGLGIKNSIGLNRQIKAFAAFESKGMIYDSFFDANGIFQSENKFQFRSATANVQYKVNTTNDLYFPKQGYVFDLKLKYAYNFQLETGGTGYNYLTSYALNDFPEFSNAIYLGHEVYGTFFNRLTASFKANVGVSIGDVHLNDASFFGGSMYSNKYNYLPFAGLQLGEVSANNYGVVSLGLDYRVFQKIYIAFNGNVGLMDNELDDLATKFYAYNHKEYLTGSSLGIKIDHPLGPMQVAYARSNNNSIVYFNLGYFF